jgi:hypothetical protein
MRARDHRLADLEQLLGLHQQPDVSPALVEWLGSMTVAQLRGYEMVLEGLLPLELSGADVKRLYEHLDRQGMELIAVPRFDLARLQNMSPAERADAYRALVRGQEGS